jgi:hypothetical protein
MSKIKIDFIPNNFRFDKTCKVIECMMMHKVMMTHKNKRTNKSKKGIFLGRYRFLLVGPRP